jgi:hypothetical protein
MPPVYGYQAQLGISTSNPVDARFDLVTESLACDENYIDTNGLRGTRSRYVANQRVGNRRVMGQLHLQPTPVELALLLPWILGGTPTGTGTVTYPLADALPTARYVTVDRGSKVFTYSGCQVSRATLTGREGMPLDLMLDVIGVDETVANSGTFPSLSIDVTTAPFIFTDLVLSVGGTGYSAKSVEIVIDNVIDRDRFYNSTTLTAAYAMDRHILVNTELPYGTASAAYNLGAAAGTAVTAVFTGTGTSVLSLSFVKVCFPRKSPTFRAGRAEQMLPMMGTAFYSGSTAELVTTLAV